MAEPLFSVGEAVESGRIRLSQAKPEDLTTMAGWLEGALAPDWRPADLEAMVKAGNGVLISDSAGDAIGMAVALRDVPVKDAACVPWLSIAPARRFRGLGGEAGIALEGLMRQKWDVERVYAPVADGRGLAVYFWLRLGFRPLTAKEAPWPLIGLSSEARPGIWMGGGGHRT
jgi:hypothetical protein